MRAAVGRSNPTQWGTVTLFAIPSFSLVLLMGYLLEHPPARLPWVYLGLSLLTFLVYAADKSAARQGARRIPESTLHLLSLCGGWPGALVAQQLLRHKSSKQPFRAVFWVTVVLNVLAFIWLSSPYFRRIGIF